MPYSILPYIKTFNLTPYLNLTTTLTINKQQIRSLLRENILINSEYVFPVLKCYQKSVAEKINVSFFPHHVTLLEAPFRTPPSHLINSCPHKDYWNIRC